METPKYVPPKENENQKETLEGVGQTHAENLLKAITDKDETEKKRILLQIGTDLNTIMQWTMPAGVENMGQGEYKIVCVTGTAGQRGLLRIERDHKNGGADIKLNFPNLDTTKNGSKPSFKEAVELLFGLTDTDKTSHTIEIGKIT